MITRYHGLVIFLSCKQDITPTCQLVQTASLTQSWKYAIVLEHNFCDVIGPLVVVTRSVCYYTYNVTKCGIGVFNTFSLK